MIKWLKYSKTSILVSFLIGMLLNSGLVLVKPLLLDRLLVIRENQLTMETILSFVLYGLCLHVLFYSTMLLANLVGNNLQRHLQLQLKKQLLRRLFLQDKYVNDEKVSIVTQDMEVLYERFFIPFSKVIGRVFILCTTIVFILWQNFWLGLIFVAFSFLRPLPQWLMNRRLVNSGAEFSDRQKEFHLSVGDFFRGADTIYFYGASRENLAQLEASSLRYENARWSSEWTSNIVYFFNGPLEFFSQVLPLALGLVLQERGVPLTTASLVAMYVATMNLSGPMQTIMYGISDIQRSRAVREKIVSLLEDVGPEVAYITVEEVSELALTNVSKEVDGRLLFHNVSFCATKPSSVLIKGASGAGKSTLLRMIAGKMKLDTGQIVVRDSSGREYANYQGNLAYISQRPFFYHASIRENLTLGQTISDQELLVCLEQVGLSSEIPNILDYQLANNGDNISGGQALRLELVRCLLRKKDIILADEITAALDKENALRVRRIISQLPVILVEVAHHVESEMDYDQVIDLGSLSCKQ